MAERKSTTKGSRVRRVTYGLNVLVAVVAATVLVVLVNVIADRAPRKALSPQARSWVRYDLTATRRYSLSPQTLKVVSHLPEGFEIVTLLTRGGPYIDQAKDLVDEYGQYGAVAAEHIDPARQPGRLKQVLSKLRSRYDASLRPIDEAVRRGAEAMAEVRRATAQKMAVLGAALEDPQVQDESDVLRFVELTARLSAQVDRQLQTIRQEVVRSIDDSLPDYASALATLRASFDKLWENDAQVRRGIGGPGQAGGSGRFGQRATAGSPGDRQAVPGDGRVGPV